MHVPPLPDPCGLDGIPAEALARDTTDIDYIIVGSGAGGGPLAARLALGGRRVLVLELGVDAGAASRELADENQRPLYHCPGLHTASVEPHRYGDVAPDTASELPVQHSSDPAIQASDSKARDFGRPGVLEQLYPRSYALGGCTAHHAMIAVVPTDEDWREIERRTGDPSWGPVPMRQLYRRMERSTRGRHLTIFGHWWAHLLDWWDPARSASAERGDRGWLDVTLSDPHVVIHDKALVRQIKRTAASAELNSLEVVWRWIKSVVAGRFFQDLDLNDARTMSQGREGVALVPLSVSTGRGRRPGERRGPREFMLETRGQLLRESHVEPSARQPALGALLIATGVRVRRVVFEQHDGTPRAIGVEFERADPETRGVCYAKAEVVLCAGTFHTPQLLMLSGIGDAAHLGALGVAGPGDSTGAPVAAGLVHLPGVGQNLRDRYEISVISRMKSDWTSLRGATFNPNDSDDPQLHEWKTHREGVYTTSGAVMAMLRKAAPAADAKSCAAGGQSPAARIRPEMFIFGFPIAFRGYYPGWSFDLLNDRSSANSYGTSDHRNLWSWVILKAFSRNTGVVRLESNSPFRLPYVNFRYFERLETESGLWRFNPDDSDLAALLSGIRFVRSVNRRARGRHGSRNALAAEIQPGIARADDSLALRDWVVSEAWGHHACGTCRVGGDPWRADPAKLLDDQAVLSSDFRVHGVRGLRVVDASVFPTIPGYFLAVPVHMVAEKAADVLLADAPEYPERLRAHEAAEIRLRRQRARIQDELPLPSPVESRELPPRTVGLALSGGGLAAAAFSLGVVQALAEKQRLRWIDFLSTVSSGGYIGGFLGALFARDQFDQRKDPWCDAEKILKGATSAPLRWMLANAPLAAGGGPSGRWQQISVALRNSLTVYFILATLLIAVFGLARALDGLPRAAAAGPLFAGPAPAQLAVWLSPWWWAPPVVALVSIIPLIVAYWLAPLPGSRRDFHLIPLAAWVVLLAALSLAIILARGSAIAATSALALLLAAVWLELVRLRPPEADHDDDPARWTGLLMRNRLTRALSVSITVVLALIAWVVIDSLARLLARGHYRRELLAAVLIVAAVYAYLPWLAAAVSRTQNSSGPRTGFRRWLVRLAAIAAVVLVSGFVCVALDLGVHRTFAAGPRYGYALTFFAIVLSVIIGRALDLLTLTSRLPMHTSRITRVFLGASNPRRVATHAQTIRSNPFGFDPDDDLALHAYRPQHNGGPLHLVGTCVRETVDPASRSFDAARKPIAMCVGPCGISVGTRYHTLWSRRLPRRPWYFNLVHWVTGLDQPNAMTLRPIPTSGDSYHVLADKSGHEVFVEQLSLGQWIGNTSSCDAHADQHSARLPSLLAGLANDRATFWWDSGLQASDRPDVFPGPPWSRFIGSLAWAVQVQVKLLAEWMRAFHGPNQRYWNLGDGGEFDALAVYELVRRRVPLIIAVDADPGRSRAALAELICLARTSFGAEIEFLSAAQLADASADPTAARLPDWIVSWLDWDALGGLATLGTTGANHAALGRITWANVPDEVAWLVYLASSITGDEGVDVLCGLSAGPEREFRDEHWESNRTLGNHVGRALFRTI